MAKGQAEKEPQLPWMNTRLSPDQRADLVLKELTLDEKILLIHGQGSPFGEAANPNTYLSNGGDGFSLGVPRLGIPPLQMIGSAYGVRFSGQNGRYSTALPSDLALSASWDEKAACDYGALIGREERAQGYNMSLAGGVNLARELRNGRTFEYQGEDPILAGTMVGERVRCEQAQHILGELKHFAVNDQETGRNYVNSVIGKRALRETDLLAFEIGNEIGHPWAVMCSYNGVNGDYACENKYLLTDVLRREWHFRGFVLSDWGATHSLAKASAAGLDMEQPDDNFYGAAMKKAVLDGKIPMAELDNHVRNILRAEFGSGIIDDPIRKSVVNVEEGLEIARREAEESIVLLKNSNGILPLNAATVKSIAIIGEHADTGMISGGGSAQVDPEGSFTADWSKPVHVWFPTSPMKAIMALATGAEVRFDSGSDANAAAELAKRSQVAIVFANQWMGEGTDLPDLSLPDKQNELIQKVAAANPNTIVVLETGTAVTMPWAGEVRGIVEAWYAGGKGADALANILFGKVNPSAKLPITFPVREADLPHAQVAKPASEALTKRAMMRSGEARPTFSVRYDEGLKVGYKWFDSENKPVLFPFGFGLSYTTFSYSSLRADREGDGEISVSFNVTNSGGRAGTEIAEVYAAIPEVAGEPQHRLVGWRRVELAPGASQDVNLTIPAKYLSIFDEDADGWKLVPGNYTIYAGGSSRDLRLTTTLVIH
ncbi:MAG TPA: glycoside hydrolase family 3 C-terminal domain-containing protein [Terracidiphilus sp.]|nr:glycoside hydrolase family 3 C-terminal domain-containing protein [Terracidiphilus sp.]